MKPQPTILIVEDKTGEREALTRLLRQEGFIVIAVSSAEEATGYLEETVDLVISDLRMGENSGLDLLQLWKVRQPGTPFIIMTAHGDVTTAVDAMKLGALDYLTKPINPDELFILINRCLEFRSKDEARKFVEVLVEHGWLAPFPDGAVINGKKRKHAWLIRGRG